jgi:putative membrane protein
VKTDAGVRPTDSSDNNSKGAGARAITGENTASDAAFSDEHFVREAAQAGLAEVKMGEIVAKNGQDQSVKDFGQRIQADHTKANEELMKIASAKGLSAPTEISAKDNQMIEHLSSLNGAEFDAATRKHAVMAHEKAVRLFKQASENAKDPELKAFAQKTLPTLQEHLDMAKRLASNGAPEVK